MQKSGLGEAALSGLRRAGRRQQRRQEGQQAQAQGDSRRHDGSPFAVFLVVVNGEVDRRRRGRWASCAPQRAL